MEGNEKNTDKKLTEKKGKDNNASLIIDSLLEGLDGVLSSKTVVGEPLKVDDTIIIPLFDVSFGIGAGASLGKNVKGSDGCGGGGLSGKMSPNSVLVVKNGQTRLVNVKNQETVTKILDMVPEVIDRFTKKNEKFPEDETVKKAAFPEEDKN